MTTVIQNQIKVFNLTSGRSLPDWVKDKKQRKQLLRSRRDGGLSRMDNAHLTDLKNLQLIHDFEFPQFARCVFSSPSGTFLFAAGDYPPRLKCFDVTQLSLKFSFNADMAIERGICLSNDYRKFVLQGVGRELTLHHTAHIIDRVRVPHIQRGIHYHEGLAEIFSIGASSELYRLNLELGAFVEPFSTVSSSSVVTSGGNGPTSQRIQTEKGMVVQAIPGSGKGGVSDNEGINGVDSFKRHGAVVLACEDGYCRVWDPRTPSGGGKGFVGQVFVGGVAGTAAPSATRNAATSAPSSGAADGTVMNRRKRLAMEAAAAAAKRRRDGEESDDEEQHVAEDEDDEEEDQSTRKLRAALTSLSVSGATCVACEQEAGLLFTVGNAVGEVRLFDLRSSKALLVKDHMSGLPIVKSQFFRGAEGATVSMAGLGGMTGGDGDDAGQRYAGGTTRHGGGGAGGGLVLSADTRTIKAWSRHDGTNFTTLECPATIYDFCVVKANHNLTGSAVGECPDSGVVTVACDMPRVNVFFVPQLGPAPRWCAYLDALTAEMEQSSVNVVYDDFRFVTAEELASLGIVGVGAESGGAGASAGGSTSATMQKMMSDGKIRPYMHGFYIEASLLRDLQAVHDPGAYNQYVQQKRQEKQDKRKEERISTFRRVEPKLPDHLISEGADGGKARLFKSTLKATGATPMLPSSSSSASATTDSRFASRLVRPEFERSQSHPEAKKMVSQIIDSKKAQTESIVAATGGLVKKMDLERLRPVNLVAAGGKRAREEDDGGKAVTPRAGGGRSTAEVPMFEGAASATIAASDKQRLELHKQRGEQKLTLAERLKKLQKAQRSSSR